MATFIASALAGVEAEDREEAHDIAQYEDVRWEVTGVTAPENLAVVLSPAMQMQNDPRRGRWPVFGRASLVFVPMLAWGAITGQSSIAALVSLVG